MNITKQRQPDNILDVLSSEELINVCGGSFHHTAADDLKEAIRNLISDSWNSFCSNFDQGYKDHIKK